MPTPCGSHTATGVPDLANGRLLVYNSPSNGTIGCRGIDIVAVPLARPAEAKYLRFEASGDPGPHLVTVDPPSAAAGTYVAAGAAFLDFTDPAHAKEIAYADPAPLVHPTDPNAIVLGGDWSSYWYNGRIYESDIRRGLIIWDLSDTAVAGARKLGHVNPQTQETSFSLNGE